MEKALRSTKLLGASGTQAVIPSSGIVHLLAEMRPDEDPRDHADGHMATMMDQEATVEETSREGGVISIFFFENPTHLHENKLH